MNFLLLERTELDGGDKAILRGRRARHLREVLRAEVGQRLRAGVIDGEIGEARVDALTATEAVVHVSLPRAAPPVHDVLLLAVPRPKVLFRMLAHAAALGFSEVILFRSWRVDKSWLGSRAMRPDAQREHLLLGLEQAGRTAVPKVTFFDRFKPMVEDMLPSRNLPTQRFVAHPAARTRTSAIGNFRGPFALAVGPDGGFLPYEVDALAAAGFHAVSMCEHALRTETALAALWDQLDLLRANCSEAGS